MRASTLPVAVNLARRVDEAPPMASAGTVGIMRSFVVVTHLQSHDEGMTGAMSHRGKELEWGLQHEQ